ncbi:MAG: FAD-binding oxidoreductase [Candidatus Competibacterales bacterium]|nr:FAD-binding oxidoreductase [Candidatus Competibacterales bacterium]
MANHDACRIPNDLAGSGWYELLPPPDPPRVLEDAIEADWVIVGGGFAGLAAARRLVQLRGGERIVLLDAQRIGWGSAGRNTGFMIDLPHELNSETYAGGVEHDLQQIRMHRAAIGFTRENVEAYGLQAFFSACGKYNVAADSTGVRALDAYSRHLDALDEPYTRLDATATHHLTGTDYYAGGIHTPGTALIQPAGYVRGLASALADRIAIHENSPVLRIETGARHIVHTPRGRVTAARVILTNNGHAESFGLYRRRLLHVFTFASMTRPLSPEQQRRLGGERQWGLIPADPMGTSLRRIGDRIVVRNTFTYNPSMRTSERQIARIGRKHDRSFRMRFPMLSDVTMQYRWGGHLCLSLNAVPAFGEVEERLYTAVCQNGLGTVKGTLAGMLIVDHATRSHHPLLPHMLAQAPPARLYPEPFMTLGARAVLGWKQWRAGRDL